MHNDFFNHFPQEGGGKFLKGKVLSDDTHKLFRVDGGGLRLIQFGLQSGGAVFQFPLLLATCPGAGDNIWKQVLIPHNNENHMVFVLKMVSAITSGWARGALASW